MSVKTGLNRETILEEAFCSGTVYFRANGTCPLYLVSCSPHTQHVVRVHGRNAVCDQLVVMGPGGRDDMLPGGHFFQLEPKGT